MPRRAHIITYGCQMNVHDSDVMMRTLEGLGWGRAAGPEDADLVLVNSCCVRQSAEERALGTLSDLGRHKSARPEMLIGVMGCLPEQPDAVTRLFRRVPHLDLVMGTGQIGQVGAILAEAEVSAGPVVHVSEDWLVPPEPPSTAEAPLRAYVNISFGCDNWCTFCIVPYVRGPQRSRPPEAIVAEVRRLVRGGTREVCLLGQNVNNYGQDLPEMPTFADLLGALDGLAGLWRLRYTSPHPKDFTPDVLERHRTGRTLCPQLHMPAQSGSDAVLERMERGYRRDQYLDLVQRARRTIPDCAITTDLIVGFPGETEEEFRQTLSLAEEVRFDKAHTFMYSPRPGTAAATMAGQVPLAERRERLARLNAVTDRTAAEANAAEVGRTRRVLVEGPSRKDPRRLTGRTPQNRIVVLDGAADLVGQEVEVRIERANSFTLFGRPV
jgi:tRNA-2-methylthio-N6-dimethylallyladenosine synthase